jgi:hypothetical protein
MAHQPARPEGKKKKEEAAPRREKRGKMINRGANPSRTYFSNHGTMACIDKGTEPTLGGPAPSSYRRDAGWGVAKKDPKFRIFRREYVMIDGVRQLATIAVPVGEAPSLSLQRRHSIDEFGNTRFDAPTEDNDKPRKRDRK